MSAAGEPLPGLMLRFMCVGAAGALGCVLRYGVNLVLHDPRPGAFPWWTLVVNVVGCAAIGLISGLAAGGLRLSATTHSAILIGLLGGLTTFSSFAWETVALLHNGRWFLAALYFAASNGIGLIAVAGCYTVGIRLAGT